MGVEARAGGCDDQNTDSNDGCSANCKVEAGFVCAGEPSACAETCGNGELDEGEGCDDANAKAGDGCFSCSLEEGFVCDNAQSPSACADVINCAAPTDSNCDSNAKCTNTPGSFSCACSKGYTGDGVTCTDVNECLKASDNNCNVNAVCTNNPGSFSCVCKKGYTGDGVNCPDDNECLKASDNNCNVNAVCTNTSGSFKCACKAGYSGDGVVTCVQPHCDGVPANCGQIPNDSCCASPSVTGGTFNLGDPAASAATIATFALDKQLRQPSPRVRARRSWRRMVRRAHIPALGGPSRQSSC